MKNLRFNRTFIIVLLMTFSGIFSPAGATIERQQNESMEELLKRATNEKDLSLIAQYPLKSFSKPGANDIICFYTPMQNDNDAFVNSVLLLCIGKEQYRLVTVDEVGPEGHIAEITSVFLANADKDKNRELVDLYSWHNNTPAFQGYYTKRTFTMMQAAF